MSWLFASGGQRKEARSEVSSMARGSCLLDHLLELSVPAGFLFGFFKINTMIICQNPYISHLQANGFLVFVF